MNEPREKRPLSLILSAIVGADRIRPYNSAEGAEHMAGNSTFSANLNKGLQTVGSRGAAAL
jgi:hypothetical protein